MGTSQWLLSDELWVRLEPLLPQRERRFRYPERKPLPDRQVRRGILDVVPTGSSGSTCRKASGSGSGRTCWPRLRGWNQAGVWQRLREVLLAELNAASRLDRSRCVVDSSHVRALTGGNRADVTQLLPLLDAIPPVRGRVVIGSNGGGLSYVAGRDGLVHRTRTALLEEPEFDKVAYDLRQFLELLEQSLTRLVTDGEPGSL
ncbi:transposase [Streptomyces achromogenes]|uniref:Transposase n=1 Tax=Streptomyces achromogenes TaxID=67255 RepID=A0ABZ1KDP3_STRAH